MYTEERPRVDSHVENSLEWYINHHYHHYLRRTMGKHVGSGKWEMSIQIMHKAIHSKQTGGI
jgi:hypothetical protein